VVDGEHDGRRLDGVEPAGIRAAEPEHGLVRVAREQHGAGGAREGSDQLHLLRIEVVRVVDQEVADAGPLGGQQVGVGGQCVQRGADQLGGVQGRRGGLRGTSPSGPTEEHDLLVGTEEPARRDPLRHVVALAEGRKVVRAQPALGRAQEQLAQLGGEPRQPDRRP
jgi:hypothetical protein